MFVIVTKGWGGIVSLLLLCGFIICGFWLSTLPWIRVVTAAPASEPFPGIGPGLIAFAIVNWFFGRWVNKGTAAAATDAQSSWLEKLFRGRHALFGLSVEYWSPVAALFGLVGMAASSLSA